MDIVHLSGVVAALDLGRHEHIALVGGGGKTTLAHVIVGGLTGTRVLTTTTKMGHDQHCGLQVVMGHDDGEIVAAAGTGPVVGWSRIDGEKAVGVSPDRCDRWFDLLDHVVVEADGARQRPFKAPADYEPVVPSTATLLVSVIGADAVGRVIADQCHRPLRVAALAGCSPYERLTPERAAVVLFHPRGAIRARPPGARLVVVINKIDRAQESLVGALLDACCSVRPDVPVITVARSGC